MTNELKLAGGSLVAAVASIGIEKFNTWVSIAAGLCAVLAALPVIVDRWPAFLRRIFAFFRR